MSVAEALGRKFVRISMGALGSTFELRGKSKAFADAEPGQIIKALIKTGVKNPLILLDEIEKAAVSKVYDPTLWPYFLEILDPTKMLFPSQYVDYPVDCLT